MTDKEQAASAQPPTPGTPTVVARTSEDTTEDYAEVRKRYLEQIRAMIVETDMADNDKFKEAINMVLDTGISHADLAVQVRMSRPSITRWALGERLPYVPTRDGVKGYLIRYLDSAIENGLGRRPRIRTAKVNGPHPNP